MHRPGRDDDAGADHDPRPDDNFDDDPDDVFDDERAHNDFCYALNLYKQYLDIAAHLDHVTTDHDDDS